MLFGQTLTKTEARNLPLRVLAHLGDAVFDLFERERAVHSTRTARQMHGKVVLRVTAGAQSALLEALTPALNEDEVEIVRMARNLKPSGYRKSGQSAYRKATAFEVLLGYLYLVDRERLRQILESTVPAASAQDTNQES
jgi:ribonuclease-3 family protein